MLRYLALVLLLAASCNRMNDEPDPVIDDPILSPIVGFSDGYFMDAEGNKMFPWGYNYTNPENVGLIEDNWENEETWKFIESDFDEMKEYAANIVRIHLQFNKFMIDASTPNTANLDRLFDFVQLAEEKGLYLDITGLASYRKSDSPTWYDEMTDEERWASQKIFWKNVAKKVGHMDAVFAFNLMNEPVVSVSCESEDDCDWLPGEDLGGFHFIQNIARDPNKTFAPTIKEWAAEMTAAIRSEDATTMVTIGFLNLGDIKQFENDLDYVSAHIYPKTGQIEDAVAFIENNLSSPLIIEETANLHCSISDLESFLDGIEGKYHGLFGHYHGVPLEESSGNEIIDALRNNFIEMMIQRNPN